MCRVAATACQSRLATSRKNSRPYARRDAVALALTVERAQVPDRFRGVESPFCPGRHHAPSGGNPVQKSRDFIGPKQPLNPDRPCALWPVPPSLGWASLGRLRHANYPRKCRLFGENRKRSVDSQNGANNPQRTLTGSNCPPSNPDRLRRSSFDGAMVTCLS
jgi:hypothetical protein